VFESFIQDHKIDLLILGTRGRTGLSKLLLGSVAQQISRHVFCPVLTVSPWSRGATRQLEMKKVLFATDLSPGAEAAIPYMLTAAKTWSTEIDVLHVCSSAHSTCRQLMDDFSHRIDSLAKSEPRFTIRQHIVHGEPSRAVLAFARQNKEDLIVLGLDRHRSLYNGPSFSHAYEIVRQAQCPVLNVRSCRPGSAGS
jgi:nucleotide-binding universal stress UspA family protein